MYGMATDHQPADVTISIQSWQVVWALLQLGVSFSISFQMPLLATCPFSNTCPFSAVSFQAVLFVFMFFPVSPHPDVPNFNWSLLVFGVVIIWAVAYYHLWGKKKYVGPVAYVRRQNM